MRVGVVGPTGPDDFADNVLNSLASMGIVATSLGSSRPLIGGPTGDALALAMQASHRLETRFQRRIVDQAHNQELDLVLTVDGNLRPETVLGLRSRGVKVALWFPDHVANFRRQLMLLAPYDRVYLKEPTVAARLADVQGLPVSYLPEACNPAWHRPRGDAGTQACIVVAGNMYPSRVMLLNRLAADGVPLRLYGSRPASWMGLHPSLLSHTGRYIVRDEKARVFREAVGVLNNLHPAEFDGVNCRLFEAAGCGAAILAEYRPTMDDLFDPETELFPFRTYSQLLDQIQALLAEPTMGVIRGDRASEHAHAQHTYHHRLTRILEDLA